MFVRRESQPAHIAVTGPAKLIIEHRQGRIVVAFDTDKSVDVAMVASVDLNGLGIDTHDSPEVFIQKARNGCSKSRI